MNRRAFLATGMAAAGQSAPAAGRIDCQSHLFCPEMLALLEKRKNSPYAYRKGSDLYVAIEGWRRRVLPKAQVFVQVKRRGTANAVLAARAAIVKGADDILVIFGDTPLIRPQTPNGSCMARVRRISPPLSSVVEGRAFRPAPRRPLTSARPCCS